MKDYHIELPEWFRKHRASDWHMIEQEIDQAERLIGLGLMVGGVFDYGARGLRSLMTPAKRGRRSA